MRNSSKVHTFHIPVMGTGFTIDTPIRVAHLGIDSVISIIDHRLLEQMREYQSKLNNIPYIPIKQDDEDCRAKSVSAYLDLVHKLVNTNFERLKKDAFEPESEITRYFDLLPEDSILKMEYRDMLASAGTDKERRQEELRNKVVPGEIQVNIMTKLDSVNYDKNNEPLALEYNDAHAALRGFATSSLNTSVVLSAGLNPRLFGYMAGFDGFFPDEGGQMKKKIILKVSDYRSALIQGKFLAKKGLWVSEFRVESGLNCGGHAFATEGHLLGPILDEFKKNKASLNAELFGVYEAALRKAGKTVPKVAPHISYTAQGGVGTYEEHEFLLNFYEMDSIGWGSPFLLVPEVVNIDNDSMELIARSDEKGFYLSNISPLGIHFNTVKQNSAEIEKQRKIDEGRPGAPCTKKHLQFNTEYTEKPICTASKQYQRKKISELDNINLTPEKYREQYIKITDKVCLCASLGNPALMNNNMDIKPGIQGVSVCPGPNMAYFSRVMTLKEMAGHIYGRNNVIDRPDRPAMFLKELKMYIDYLKSKIDEVFGPFSESQLKYFSGFQSNLNEGINYYKNLFLNVNKQHGGNSGNLLSALDMLRTELNHLKNRLIPTALPV